MWCAPEVRCYGGPGVFVFADDGAQFFRSIEEAAGWVEAIDVEVDRAVGVQPISGTDAYALEEVAFLGDVLPSTCGEGVGNGGC